MLIQGASFFIGPAQGALVNVVMVWPAHVNAFQALLLEARTSKSTAPHPNLLLGPSRVYFLLAADRLLVKNLLSAPLVDVRGLAFPNSITSRVHTSGVDVCGCVIDTAVSEGVLS